MLDSWMRLTKQYFALRIMLHNNLDHIKIDIDDVLRIYDFGNFLDKKGETYWTKIWRINGWKGKAYIGKNEEENRSVPSIHRQRTTAVNIETIPQIKKWKKIVFFCTTIYNNKVVGDCRSMIYTVFVLKLMYKCMYNK